MYDGNLVRIRAEEIYDRPLGRRGDCDHPRGAPQGCGIEPVIKPAVGRLEKKRSALEEILRYERLEVVDRDHQRAGRPGRSQRAQYMEDVQLSLVLARRHAGQGAQRHRVEGELHLFHVRLIHDGAAETGAHEDDIPIRPIQVRDGLDQVEAEPSESRHLVFDISGVQTNGQHDSTCLPKVCLSAAREGGGGGNFPSNRERLALAHSRRRSTPSLGPIRGDQPKS